MAQLRNTKYFTFDPKVWGARSSVTVGHNRVLRFENGILPKLTGELHGHVVFQATQALSGTIMISLNHAGWLTTTTIAAIGDFMEGLGISGSASRAKGIFSARWLPHRYEHGKNEDGSYKTNAADYLEADADKNGQIRFDVNLS